MSNTEQGPPHDQSPAKALCGGHRGSWAVLIFVSVQTILFLRDTIFIENQLSSTKGRDNFPKIEIWCSECPKLMVKNFELKFKLRVPLVGAHKKWPLFENVI